ncbi:hypothetical protein OJF2_69460 [Aquisphaera giovannonii]|uniref:Uncharacterized protein n=1 Tax=Aquisphaera giovannonii TaxID=406548 RepID=A0A5B9WE59_9BACT|nr:hypothetical protein [Aquisphaera giovannonii]QEH38345.1 hypothetical protein OJF2_69460 [Aquisphaera giovannonii]
MPDGLGDERLERLEKELERVKREADRANASARTLGAVLAVALLGAGGWLATMYSQGKLRLEPITGGVAEAVEAKEFGFYNRDNTRVFLIDDDKFGHPELILMDLKKKYKMGLKVWADGGGTPGLAFYDDSGLRGHLRMNGEGASLLKLMGPHDKGSILLSVSEEGDPRLVVTDKAGKVLLAVPEGARDEKPPPQYPPGRAPGVGAQGPPAAEKR